MAPAQGAIPGILRFGTREHGLRGGERDTQSWVGGGAWPLGSPSGPNLGLSFPWPCPLPLLDASGRGGGAQRRCPVCRLAGGWSALHPCLSVSPGPQRWGSLLGWGEGLTLSHFLSLSPSQDVLSLSPRSFLGCHPVPISACLAGGGARGSSISAFVGLSLSLRLQVPFF